MICPPSSGKIVQTRFTRRSEKKKKGDGKKRAKSSQCKIFPFFFFFFFYIRARISNSQKEKNGNTTIVLFRNSLSYLCILHDFYRSRNNIQRKKRKQKKGKTKKFLITDPFFPFLFPHIRNFFPFLFVRRHRSSIDLYEIFHRYRYLQRYLPPCTSCFRLPLSVHPVPSNFAISPSLS